MRVTSDDRSGADEPWFRHLRRVPSGAVGEFVRESWLVQAARCRTAVERALPDASVEIYINLDQAGRHLYTPSHERHLKPRAAWVVGPHAQPLFIEKEIADCDIVGVRLQPGAAARILGVPVTDLCDSLVDLDVFWGSSVETLRDRLHSAPDASARLSLLESTIAHGLSHRAASHDLALVRSLEAMARVFPGITIARLAAAHGLSHRRAISVLEDGVGLKPKLLHRVQRVRRVLHEVHAPVGGRRSWARIADRCGYFDQAHMINDFRALSGLRPTEYDEKRSSVGRGFAQYIAAVDR